MGPLKVTTMNLTQEEVLPKTFVKHHIVSNRSCDNEDDVTGAISVHFGLYKRLLYFSRCSNEILYRRVFRKTDFKFLVKITVNFMISWQKNQRLSAFFNRPK